MEAVSVACLSARAQRSKVYVIHVIEVRRALPVNAELDTEARHGEQILRKAEEIAGRVGVAVHGELLQARDAGPALVEEALAREADAVVVGLSISPVLGQFRLGGTAAHVLQNAPCDVWLIRQGTNAKHHESGEVDSQ